MLAHASQSQVIQSKATAQMILCNVTNRAWLQFTFHSAALHLFL